MNTFFTEMAADLFARQAFTANLLQHNFNRPEGWLELAAALALMLGSFWLAQRLSGRKPEDPRHPQLLRHLGQRILWPLIMLAAAVAALFVCRLNGYTALWLQLLVLAARWMILIRLAVGLVHAALPKNRFSDWLERSVSSALWVGFILWITEIDDHIIAFLQSIQFSVGSGKLNLYTLLSGILWVGVLMVVALWLARLINGRLARSSLDSNLRIILSKVITGLMMLLAVLIALPMVGIDLTVLSVFGGALGVGIGFGLQKIASNYVSGFIILGDRSIRINDLLTVNNFNGYVTRITSRFVVLRSKDGTEALIPNETFINSMVVNNTHTAADHSRTISVAVDYRTDLPTALTLLQQTAAAQHGIAQEPAPAARMGSFGEHGMVLNLIYIPINNEQADELQSELLLAIWQQFQAHGIAFTPQTESSPK